MGSVVLTLGIALVVVTLVAVALLADAERLLRKLSKAGAERRRDMSVEYWNARFEQLRRRSHRRYWLGAVVMFSAVLFMFVVWLATRG